MSFLVFNGKFVKTGGGFVGIPNPKFPVQLSGHILSEQGANITQRGFIYGPSADDLSLSVVSPDNTTFFLATASLPKGTYYYKSYATNSYGTAYGDLKSVTV